MKEYRVPIQSLIDHIKTATDVDPWAKEMAEELLKEQEAVKPKTDDAWPSSIKVCGVCGTCLFAVGDYKPKYCSECGIPVKWS